MRNTLITTATLALALLGCGRANYTNTDASYDANPGIHYDTGFDASFDAPRPDAPRVDAPSDAFVLADAAFDAGFDAPPDATLDAPPDAFVVPPDAFVIAPCSPTTGTLGNNMDFELGDTGAWMGDLHADVTAEMGIVPRSGTRMLRVLGTTPTGGGGANFDYFQHLSLTSFRPQIDSGTQRFVFNVNVNRVPAASNAAYVFVAFYDSAGGLITMRGYSDVAPFRVDSDVATWECINVAGMVPVSTDSVDLQISWATPDFAGQYYDDAAFVLP